MDFAIAQTITINGQLVALRYILSVKLVHSVTVCNVALLSSAPQPGLYLNQIVVQVVGKNVQFIVGPYTDINIVAPKSKFGPE